MWLRENGGTLLVLAVLILIVIAVIRSMIADQKSGRTGCSHGCTSCALHGECHKMANTRAYLESRKKQTVQSH